MSLATRMEFGKALIELAKTRDFMLLSADTKACGIENFGKLYPGREYNVGIAEQNLIGVAAGIASCGYKVFATTYAVFASMRACEQVRTFVCYPNLNVALICSHGGLQVGPDGATHMATEDISIMRSFPNMTVIQPSDAVSARAAARAAVDFEGPLYIRLMRDPVEDIHDETTYNFEIGKAKVLRNNGNDVAIIATGIMVGKSLKAAEKLQTLGINARVVEVHTIKPLDEDTVVEAARATGAVVTVEDHTIYGGLGSAVAEILGEKCPVKMRRIGIKDAFGESGAPELLYKKHGMLVDDIVAAAQNLKGEKSGRI